MLAQAQASRTTVAEIERFSALLEICDGLTVAQFEKLVSEAMGKAPPPKPAGKPINNDLVADYFGKLVAAGEDRAAFEGVMAGVMADTGIRTGELSAIARAYVGGSSAYKKKADAITDIRLCFEAKVSTTRRLRAQSDIF